MIMKQSSKYYVLTHLLAFASLHSATTRELEAIYLPQLPVINSSPHPYGYGNFVYPWYLYSVVFVCSGERVTELIGLCAPPKHSWPLLTHTFFLSLSLSLSFFCALLFTHFWGTQ